jgi:hypothetical protein
MNLKQRKKISFEIIFIFGILFFSINLLSADTTNTPVTVTPPIATALATTTPPIATSTLSSGFYSSSNWQSTLGINAFVGGQQTFNPAFCQGGQDFLIQLAPFGCTPAVVRSDLLAEQNVPVLCQLAATQINPLVNVKAINTLTFSGQNVPPEIADIGYYPAQAALGITNNLISPQSTSTQSKTNYPLLSNIGYVVLVLRQQQNQTNLPDFVQGNLTAKIQYDLNNAFGVGNTHFYLPEMSQAEWANYQNQYTFWNGKASIMAEAVNLQFATIALYSNSQKIAGITLQKGQTSNIIYIPGLQCMAGLQLRLDSLEDPSTKIQLKIDGDRVDVVKNEGFLENRCTLRSIYNNGLYQKVGITCSEDEKSTSFELTVNPRIEINIIGISEKKQVEKAVGEKITESFGHYIYVGYIGTTDKLKTGVFGAITNNNLVVYLYDSDKDLGTKLDSSTLTKIISQVESSSKNAKNKDVQYFIGDNLKGIVPPQVIDVGGINFQLVGFSSAINSNINDNNLNNLKTNYDNAMNDFKTIYESYSTVQDTSANPVKSYGEEALGQAIILADSLDQKSTLLDLCNNLKQKYPELVSSYSMCDDLSRVSSLETSTFSVTINGNVKTITFDGIYEPTFEQYGAVIYVNGKEFDLSKNQIQYLNDTNNLSAINNIYYLQLVSVIKDSASGKDSVQVNVNLPHLPNQTSLTPISGTYTLQEGVASTFGSQYNFLLSKVNLKKVASVSIIPSINNQGNDVNFSFKIGIEKSAIPLSPEQIEKKIKNLNETIKDWEDKSQKLGTTVTTLNKACLAVGLGLAVDNLVNDASGTAIARKKVMDKEWKPFCQTEVSKGTYSTLNQCYLDKSSDIDKSVTFWADAMNPQNEEIKQMEQKYVIKDPVFGDTVINTDNFMKEDIPAVVSSLSSLGTISDPTGGNGKPITQDQISKMLTYNMWKNNSYDIEQLREIDLYRRVLEKDPNNKIALNGLYSDLSVINSKTEEAVQVQSLQNQLSQQAKFNSPVNIYGEKTGLVGTYSGGTRSSGDILVKSSDGTLLPFDIGDKTPVEVFGYQSPGGTKEYVAILNNVGSSTYAIKGVYNYEGIDSSGKIIVGDKADIIAGKFQKFVSTGSDAFHNTYKNPKLSYYETEPYKGLPALVPFDLKNGWYVYVTQTLGTTPISTSYQQSGAPKNFWICNVGANGMEERMDGDDACQLINLGTGQPSNSILGLSATDSTNLFNNAQKALQQASKAYKDGLTGTVSILNQRIPVGEPAVDVPDIQCQDFMSPDDCQILFNVCDPVVCPSSRCNYGGSYYVKDVVQSGIIGSLMLCLPNVREGIYVPVCLTGLKAGIDGYLSVLDAYRDCLQTNLDTGQLVGVCDEIYSIHLCDFFWRQALPLAKLIIPKTIEWMLGENVKGGGEYMNVQAAWDNAEKSVNYFTQYYAGEGILAFKTKITEAISESVCKLSTSATYPDSASVLNSLTNPRSPPQFHGTFQEIPFTSATVIPVSQYKVFYHIYAGQDSQVYYQVYLKGAQAGSFYQDTSLNRYIDSGYVPRGQYVDQTKDFTAPSGYKQLCINVNGQEECGFQEVSTSFAVDYLTEQYVASQANQTGITTTDNCISGTTSIYSLLNINPQSVAEGLIDPAIYERGIIRVCATSDPGQGTDPYTGTEKARWRSVGYCDNQNIKCWIDTNSLNNVINVSQALKTDVLNNLNQNYQATLNNGTILTGDEFNGYVSQIKSASTPDQKISIINGIITRFLLNSDKAVLYYERGKAYSELAQSTYKEIKDKLISIPAGSNPDDYTAGGPGTNEDTSGAGSQTGVAGASNLIKSDADISVTLNPLRDPKQVYNAILYAKTNTIGSRNCACGNDCESYANMIYNVALSNKIDSILLLSLMMQESSCNKTAIATTSDGQSSVGLMQINTNHCKDYTDIVSANKETCKSQLLANPNANIQIGAKILKNMHDNFGSKNTTFNACTTPYKGVSYTGWPAALRGYNGFGCGKNKDGTPAVAQDKFVDEVISRYVALNKYVQS